LLDVINSVAIYEDVSNTDETQGLIYNWLIQYTYPRK
jgi:hypothetical protein